jgi:hypothetical protein
MAVSLRSVFGASGLRALAKRTKDGPQVRRLYSFLEELCGRLSDEVDQSTW